MADIDMDARYRVEGWSGIAWYPLGYARRWTEEEWLYCGEGDPEDESSYVYCEPEEIEDRSMVRMVMVGDDRVFEVDPDDLVQLDDDDYCPGCGQIGCKAYG